MLTTVRVYNTSGAELELPLWESESGYQVRNIDGLDPADAILSTSDTARIDGTQFQSQRTGSRNIVITLGLESPDNSMTVDELRQGLYPFFMPKTSITLRFMKLDGSLYEISGKVETMEAPLFSEDPEATISIMCFSPDFVSPAPLMAIVPARTSALYTQVEIVGNVPTGFDFEHPIVNNINRLKIDHLNDTSGLEAFEVLRTMPSGGSLRFGTKPRSKYAHVTVGSTVTQILNSVTPESEWFTLLPGNNFLRVFTNITGGEGRFSYLPRFGGL